MKAYKIIYGKCAKENTISKTCFEWFNDWDSNIYTDKKYCDGKIKSLQNREADEGYVFALKEIEI